MLHVSYLRSKAMEAGEYTIDEVSKLIFGSKMQEFENYEATFDFSYSDRRF